MLFCQHYLLGSFKASKKFWFYILNANHGDASFLHFVFSLFAFTKPHTGEWSETNGAQGSSLPMFGNTHFPHTANMSQHWKNNQESPTGPREHIQIVKPRHPSVPVLWLLVRATAKTMHMKSISAHHYSHVVCKEL